MTRRNTVTLVTVVLLLMAVSMAIAADLSQIRTCGVNSGDVWFSDGLETISLGQGSNPGFSNNGKFFFYDSNQQIKIYNFKGKLVETVSGNSGAMNTEGTAIAFVAPDNGALKIWTKKLGKRFSPVRLSGSGPEVNEYLPSWGSRYIAYNTMYHEYSWDPDRGERTYTITTVHLYDILSQIDMEMDWAMDYPYQTEIIDPDISPDDRYFAYNYDDFQGEFVVVRQTDGAYISFLWGRGAAFDPYSSGLYLYDIYTLSEAYFSLQDFSETPVETLHVSDTALIYKRR